MKKFFLTLLLTAITLGASAQLRWGPTVGVDLSTLKFKQDLFDVDKTVGGSAGVMGELMFPGIGFGIDLGALYEMRGAKLHLGQRKIWASQGYESPRVFLHYLNIPLHLRFKWTRMEGFEDYLAPYIFGGPEFGFLLGHSHIPALDYAGGEIGLAAGIGFELFRRWQVQGSYTWGVTYALKTSLLTNMSGQNRTWNVRVIYLF